MALTDNDRAEIRALVWEMFTPGPIPAALEAEARAEVEDAKRRAAVVRTPADARQWREQNAKDFTLLAIDMAFARRGFPMPGDDASASAPELGKALSRWRGVHEAGRAYERDDLVTKGGGLWIATAATKETPGNGATAWRLAVKRGAGAR